MKEAIVKYKSNKTLAALKAMGQYLGFTVEESIVPKKPETMWINNVPVLMGDASVDVSELAEIFTGKGLNATEIRKSGWQRKKIITRHRCADRFF